MIARNICRSLIANSGQRPLTTPFFPRRPLPAVPLPPIRYASHSNRTSVNEKIEEIQELYATARDEFEIASEETLKKTVYAADDRAAAAEELTKLKHAFDKAVIEQGGEEIRTRVGGRIRELERAVEAMEESAMED